MKQALLFKFLPSNTQLNLQAPIERYNGAGNLKTHNHGRPGFYLTAQELLECMRFHLSKDDAERKRLLAKFGLRRLKIARAICQLDVGTRGRIGRYKCGLHGTKYLTFNWTGAEDGCRVRCFAPGGCRTNTHFSGYMFAGGSECEDSE
jgi:hypothetical protein